MMARRASPPGIPGCDHLRPGEDARRAIDREKLRRSSFTSRLRSEREEVVAASRLAEALS